MLTPEESQELRQIRGQGGAISLGPVGGELFPNTPDTLEPPPVPGPQTPLPQAQSPQQQTPEQPSPNRQNMFVEFIKAIAPTAIGAGAGALLGGKEGAMIGGQAGARFSVGQGQGQLQAERQAEQRRQFDVSADLRQQQIDTSRDIQEQRIQAQRDVALARALAPPDPTKMITVKIGDNEVAVLDPTTGREVRRLTGTQASDVGTDDLENKARLANLIAQNAKNGLWNRARELAMDSGDVAIQEDLIAMRAAEEAQRREELAQASFAGAADLRKEYTMAAKEFVASRDAIARVVASAEKADAPGDLALIFNYMKVLDPGSVVRESEFATAQATGSLWERARAYLGRVGEGNRLSDTQREAFVNRAKTLFAAQEAIHRQRVNEFTRLAPRGGFDPADVIIDLGAIAPPPSEETVGVDTDEMTVGEIQAEIQDLRKIGVDDMTDAQVARYRKLLESLKRGR